MKIIIKIMELDDVMKRAWSRLNNRLHISKKDSLNLMHHCSVKNAARTKRSRVNKSQEFSSCFSVEIYKIKILNAVF